jgi:hypothetical protein
MSLTFKTYIMKHSFNLDIKSPCGENFNQFTPTQKGGFCDSCKKEVIDFTTMNSQDIITYFETKTTENTCGRFKSNQLKTYSKNIQKRKKISVLSGLSLAFISVFSMRTAQAQDTNKNLKTEDNTVEIKSTNSGKTITVKGTVTAENNLPLPGANIVLQGTSVGITTDFDGNFKFPEKLKKGDILLISYIGYASKKIVVDTDNATTDITLNINMNPDSCVLLGKVAIKQVYKSKK